MQAAETPMLKQYNAIKAKYKEHILLFRLGDFYEMFFEDAKVVSRELDIVLTSRGKTPAGKIPMCGFPHHAATGYIEKLIKAGYKVAICEQTEDPALAKGIVKREVTRIITSGTFLDENSTDARYLLCLSPTSKQIGISFIEPSSGVIHTNQYESKDANIIELIASLSICECVFPQRYEDDICKLFQHPFLKLKNIMLSPYNDWCFNPDIAKKSLCDHFGIHNLKGFGIEDKNMAISSTGALLEYMKQMNKQPLRHIHKISLYADRDYVFISPAAYYGLEIHTLIKNLTYTRTAMGKRKLHFWLTHPLKDISNIKERQEAVELLRSRHEILSKLKPILDKIPDIEKNISRLSCGYTHAKDLLAIRNTLALIPELGKIISPIIKQNNLFYLQDIPDLRNYLLNTINEEIPLSNPEGKIIKTGYNPELDSLRDIQTNGKEWLKKFQEEEIARTGINSLKVGFNKVFGYYIEITKANLNMVPKEYIRKQTLVNAERFITPKLKEFEEKILTAQDRILTIEAEILKNIQKTILDYSAQLQELCNTIAIIDVIYSFAVLSIQRKYIVPDVSNDELIDIKDGRHPVVEKMLEESFIPNDTLLDCNNRMIILTGPNMSGKSTYIRQTAILVIMAQAGSFIPASSAHIGIVDKIFTRIGAHDDISKGQSTFMVEMNEAADILNNCTEKSLIILDEIGRGTSTYDGLSLAWAIAEYLHKTKARTLFATHFHELTVLAEEYEGIQNYNVAVKEWEDKVIFMHKIIKGSTDDSYGIYVAKLAGMPETVINRAKQILTQLELKNNLKEKLKNKKGKKKQNIYNHQFDLFNQNLTYDTTTEKIKIELKKVDINNITPIQAFNKLVDIKKLLEENS